MSETYSSDRRPTIVFTYGRMNPPHSGHMGLLKEMIRVAIETGAEHVVILLSSSRENKKNPLECAQKKSLALNRGMLEKAKDEMGEEARHIEVHVYCPEDLETGNSASSMIKKATNIIYGDEPTHLIMIVGEDRESQFNWIGKSVAPNTFQARSSKRSESGISATRIRGYVSSGDLNGFITDMSPTGLSESDMISLFEAIKSGMEKEEIPLDEGKEPPKSKLPKSRKTSSTKETPATKKRKAEPIEKEAKVAKEEAKVAKEEAKEEEEEEDGKSSGRRRSKTRHRKRGGKRRCTKKHRHNKSCRR